MLPLKPPLGAALVLFLCDTIQNLGEDISLLLPSSRAVAVAYFLNRFLAFLALLGVNYGTPASRSLLAAHIKAPALSGLSHALSDRVSASVEVNALRSI